MSAPKGNRYHEKYSLKDARELFEKSLHEVRGDDDLLFIGSLAVRMGIYRELYYHLLSRFDDEELHTTKRKIDSILESRVVEKAVSQKGNPTFSIFMLKNNHGWADKQEIKHEGGLQIKTSAKSKKKIDELGDD